MITDPKAENSVLKEQIFNLKAGITKTVGQLNDKIRIISLSGDADAKVRAEAYKDTLAILETNLDKFI